MLNQQREEGKEKKTFQHLLYETPTYSITQIPTMNVFRGLISIPRISCVSQIYSARQLSSTLPLSTKRTYDKFYKITKQLQPIDKNVYEIGQERPDNISIPKDLPEFPKYEYEPRFFKRQNRGLYGGLQRKRSKSCSEYLNKTLRAHRPNAQWTKLWSETLNRRLRLRVATRVLKTISKEGGLDQYLLKSTPARVKTMGLKAWQLRYRILQEREQKQRGNVTLLDGTTKPIQYISSNGLKFHATKDAMLSELYEAVQRDSYYPIKPFHFERDYSWLSYEEIVKKLEQYNWDFSELATK